MRGRFAMRLADYKDEDGAVARLGGVRDAFNSPFRPFILATTSVGQEGLDFHPYCYRVYHWNLPGNPVDLEQREGRVHRFKGHAVRLNLAERQAAVVRGRGQTTDDPWKLMFECARSEATIDTDLIPYWIYEGSVRVERRVPRCCRSAAMSRVSPGSNAASRSIAWPSASRGRTIYWTICKRSLARASIPQCSTTFKLSSNHEFPIALSAKTNAVNEWPPPCHVFLYWRMYLCIVRALDAARSDFDDEFGTELSRGLHSTRVPPIT